MRWRSANNRRRNPRKAFRRYMAKFYRDLGASPVRHAYCKPPTHSPQS
jgi:hypothetical protein